LQIYKLQYYRQNFYNKKIKNTKIAKIAIEKEILYSTLDLLDYFGIIIVRLKNQILNILNSVKSLQFFIFQNKNNYNIEEIDITID